MQGSTTGAAAPLRFTTMRLEAHITSFGSLPKMPQQLSVISGTSARRSISGNRTSFGWIVGVERPAALGDQRGIAVARGRLALAPAGAPGQRQRKAFTREPVDAFDCLGVGPGGPLGVVQLPRVVIEADAKDEIAAMRLR